jgi:hypothetical protein
MEKDGEKQLKPESHFREKARQYFSANFPELGISQNILDLVGILTKSKKRYERTEYHVSKEVPTGTCKSILKAAGIK